jgi:hypothetical protein
MNDRSGHHSFLLLSGLYFGRANRLHIKKHQKILFFLTCTNIDINIFYFHINIYNNIYEISEQTKIHIINNIERPTLYVFSFFFQKYKIQICVFKLIHMSIHIYIYL